MKEAVSGFKWVLKNPRGFFGKAAGEKDMRKALRFLLLLSAIPAFGYPVVEMIADIAISGTLPSPLLAMAFVAFVAALIYLFLIVLVVAACFIVHAVARTLGCRRGWRSTARAVIYGYAPVCLLGWLPLAAFVGTVWSMLLTVIGISMTHRVSIRRAALIVVPLELLVITLLWGTGGLDVVFGPRSSELVRLLAGI